MPNIQHHIRSGSKHIDGHTIGFSFPIDIDYDDNYDTDTLYQEIADFYRTQLETIILPEIKTVLESRRGSRQVTNG